MTIRGFKNLVRNKIWRFLKAQWTLRSGVVVRIENDSDWFVFNEIFASKEYDSAFQLFLPCSSVRPLILDLGANVGYFALRIADELLLSGCQDFEIISVEASPVNFRGLAYRLGQPALKNKVKAILGLAGEKTGTAKIFHSGQHFGHSALGNMADTKAPVVSYIDIDALTAGREKIDFLKCDIEGSEEVFLKSYGGLLQKVDNAVFEFHAGECNVDNCHKLLEEAGLLSRGVIKQDPVYRTTVEIFSRNGGRREIK
jgi:FkbM family methyltransferase